jgi:hypothetical protein
MDRRPVPRGGDADLGGLIRRIPLQCVVAECSASPSARAIATCGAAYRLALPVDRRHPLRILHAINVRLLGADLVTVHVQLLPERRRGEGISTARYAGSPIQV